MLLQSSDDRWKVHVPSPGTLNAPLITASRKLQFPVPGKLNDFRPHILAMHMADARYVLLRTVTDRHRRT